MSVQAPDRPTSVEGELDQAPSTTPDGPTGKMSHPGIEPDDLREPSNPLLVSVAALLATAAAGWLVAGIFRGGSPYVLAMAGSIVGAGGVAMSYRTARPAVLQWITIPIAAIVGAVFVAADATGGSANLPSLIVEALEQGGLSQPPVPFSPGWKFLVVVVLALLGSASASIAIAQDRPRLAVFLPLPVVFAALLLQSGDTQVLSTVVALGFVVAALAVSFGAEMGRDQATTGQFESRRFARAASMLAGIVVVLVALTRVGFLFPDTDTSDAVPPKRPDPPPPQADRELFVVEGDRALPIRIGVLDGYDGEAFLLPPFDKDRLISVDADGPGAVPEPLATPGEGGTIEVSLLIREIGGHILPAPANPVAVRPDGFGLDYDPRTQVLTLPDRRATDGMRYSVEVVTPPGARSLDEAPEPRPELAEYLDAPEVPFMVTDLLGSAPPGGAFTRLQHLRDALYLDVVAAGEGSVVEVPPERVVEMLNGGDASPYEIVAAEVLLARWAGVPARMGFGYYDGEPQGEGAWSYRPSDGRAWLEAYFEGHGWVPIVGTPAQAKPSLTDAQQTEDPTIRPSEDVVVPVFIPVQLDSLQLFFVLARYWVGRLLPIALVIGLALWLYPAGVRAARRSMRRRWAVRHGLAARIAVAYSELRDGAADMGVGEPRLTPLQFLERVDPDLEHRELAWLVTRALWGDLRRDLRPEDARAAEDLSASVLRRMRGAQTASARLLAAASRRSLANPFSDEIPNLWWTVPPRQRIRAFAQSVSRRVRSSRPLLRSRRLRPVGAAALALVVVLAASLAGCAQTVDLSDEAPGSVLPVLPTEAAGFVIRPEPEASSTFDDVAANALVADGAVYSVLGPTEDGGEEVVASVQVAAFKPGLHARRREVRLGVLESIGRGRFETGEIGALPVYTLEQVTQRMLLWFPRHGANYLVMVAKPDFEQAGNVVAALVESIEGTADQVAEPPDDPKRGFDG